MRYAVLLIASTTILAACVGPFIPVVKISQLPPEKQAALTKVKVYEPSDIAGLSYTLVGDLTGNSCKNVLWEPPASREDAVNQLRYWALERGANGLTEIKCEQARGTSLGTNCWESLTCTGKALKVQSK